MSVKSIERPCTEAESAFLTERYETAQANRRQDLVPAAALPAWVFLMGGFLALWAIVAWAAAATLHVEIGMHSFYSPQILAAGAMLAALPFAVEATRKMLWRRKHIARLHEELTRNLVCEEHFIFTEARCFQEQEHGGLIYFLHTDDDRVFVMYDTESQQLRIDGGNPFASAFAPCGQLERVRTPQTRIPLATRFSGFRLNAGGVFDLLANPEDWPEDGDYCDCPWSDLITRYASPA